MLLALVAIMMPIGAWATIWIPTVEIEIPKCGFSTFYYSDFSYEIPEGISASIITELKLDEDGMVTEIVEQPVEYYIPAGCAVILRGEQGTYYFYESRESEQPYSENLLKGTDEETTFAEEGFIYFTLDSENEENSASLKDWICVPRGIMNEAHKAYLALPVDDYPELAAMLEALDNPHLQHTHGGCEICGQVTGVEAAWGASADDLILGGTLDDAFAAAAEENSTVGYIQLQVDVENGVVINGSTFTLDLNGHTIGASDESHGLQIQGADTHVTLKGETEGSMVFANSESSPAVYVIGGASVTIESGTYTSCNHIAVNNDTDCSVTIIDGVFESTSSHAIENWGDLVIKGGTFTSSDDLSTICYSAGSINLSEYENITDISISSWIDPSFIPNAETILLPEGYCFFDSEGDPVSAIMYSMDYSIGIEPETKYTITFAAGDGEGEMADGISYGKYSLPECTFTAPEGMGFKAWQVGEDEFQPGVVVTIEDDATITAVWATLFEVSFDANGGTGSMDAVTTFSDFTLPECTFTAPEGMMFKAWQIGEDEYQPNETVTIMDNTTITALWTDYVPQIVIKMHDSAEDGWHGDAIVVKKNGEEIGTATIEYGADGIVRYEYDNTADYTFYWSCNHEQELEENPEYSCCPNECSFEIFIDEEEVFAAVRDEEENTYDCEDYDDGELIYTIEGEAQVVESLTINDGELTEYNNTVSFTTVGTLTYTRTLPNLMWNALYVPFEIPLSELAENYDVAYINDIRSYDKDENGEIDDMTMEIIRINSGTLNANHPYLIRAKNEEAQNMEIVLSDATLYRTEEISLNCSSMYMEFTITGTYNTLSYEDLEEKYAISTSGAWQKLSEGSSLKPFRLYMEMTPRDGSPVKVEAAALSRIRINMQGEDGNTTGVEILEAPQSINDAVLYDLYGRKVTTPVKGGIYISNGKKVIVK